MPPDDAGFGLNTPVVDKVMEAEDDIMAVTGSTKAPAQDSTGALIQYWVDRALKFFSHASNETLGACFVGLGASTYLVLGRFGLVLMGVVGGIALHATWESGSGSVNGGPESSVREQRRRELGIEVVNRIWNWRDEIGRPERGEGQDGQGAMDLDSKKKLDFAGFEPETAAALDTFTTAVIRDYVQYVCPT